MAVLYIFPNPFAGIICEPFYHLWILIIIVNMLNLFVWKRIAHYRQSLIRATGDVLFLPNSSKKKLNKKVYDEFEAELRLTSFEVATRQYMFFPEVIINEIMSMLPPYTDPSVNYWLDYAGHTVYVFSPNISQNAYMTEFEIPA
eukprot:1092792_1